MHLRVTLRSLGRPLAQNALTFVFLPYEAYISLDAIAHAVRVDWTKWRLLEWKTASDSERGANGNLADTFADGGRARAGGRVDDSRMRLASRGAALRRALGSPLGLFRRWLRGG